MTRNLIQKCMQPGLLFPLNKIFDFSLQALFLNFELRFFVEHDVKIRSWRIIGLLNPVINIKYFLVFLNAWGPIDVYRGDASADGSGLKPLFNVFIWWVQREILGCVTLPGIEIANTMDALIYLLLNKLIDIYELPTFLFWVNWLLG